MSNDKGPAILIDKNGIKYYNGDRITVDGVSGRIEYSSGTFGYVFVANNGITYGLHGLFYGGGWAGPLSIDLAEKKNLSLEDLKSFSNDGLHVAIAEELGYTDIAVREIPIPWLMDLVEPELSGYLDGELMAIPHYSARIYDAMCLFNRLPLPRYIEENKNGDVICSFGRPLYAIEMINDNYSNTLARAISCAYLLSRQGKE